MRFNNRVLLICLISSVCSMSGCASDMDSRSGSDSANGGARNKPNIVFIIADDMGYGDLRCYGAPDTKTPSLDALAKQGVMFTQFYANGPECTPTRTAIMTGRYQQRAGGLECAIGTDNVGRYDDAIRLAKSRELGLPASKNTLVRGMKAAGYRTALMGKWHLGYEDKFHPQRHGFDHALYIEGGNCDYFRHTESTGRNVLRLNGKLIKREGYMTDLITNEAVTWLLHQSKADPFFMMVTYTAPHFPFQTPGTDTGRLHPKEKWSTGERSQYVQMVNYLDSGIGLILKTLEAKHLSENTLVVFISDHGGTPESRNAPYSGHKGGLMEGGIRVPCIARWPGHLPAGKKTDRMGMTFDLSRSILRAAGATGAKMKVGKLDGIDILQAVENDSPEEGRTLFWRGKRGERTWRAVRDGDWKYITKVDDDAYNEWLFNLKTDPKEKSNLMRANVTKVKQLESKLEAWEKSVKSSR
jgi:arylsulfatase A-like enzyme